VTECDRWGEGVKKSKKCGRRLWMAPKSLTPFVAGIIDVNPVSGTLHPICFIFYV